VLDLAAAIGRDSLPDDRAQPVIDGEITGVGLTLDEEGLCTGREIGHECRRPLGGPCRLQRIEQRCLHSTRSTKTRTLPPQARPTSQACSLVTPNSRRRGLPSAIAASAS